ncbi:MAG TPA: enoyl-CoA hydratase-related protein [Gemmatimonadales bacterium]
MYTTLLFEIRDGIAFVTVNRPDKLNALNDDVITELGQMARQVADDGAIGAVILTGSGAKAFVAGADITQLAQTDVERARDLSRKGSSIFRQLERLTKPIIAAVNGFALGGGCELAMACHVRLASENARFGQPEVKLGTCPGYGGTVRLARLVGRGRAIELLATGAMIDAAEAYRIGLVNRVVAAEQLLAEAEKLARAMMEQGPLAVAACLALVDDQENHSLESALERESEVFADLAATADFREGTAAFIEKRKPVFRGG